MTPRLVRPGATDTNHRPRKGQTAKPQRLSTIQEVQTDPVVQRRCERTMYASTFHQQHEELLIDHAASYG